MNQSLFARARSSFLAGLAVVLPAVVSIVALTLVFGTVANVTDTLLFFLPRDLTHRDHGAGPMYWYWSLCALLLTLALICGVGVLARNYFGRKMIEWVDRALLHVPFLNKIYGATKQVNEALTSGNRNAFKTVVLIEFPHPGTYAVGFITGEAQAELRTRLKEKMVCVFVPTTPNPTSGFMMLVPEDRVIKLEMSVAEGIKYIISLGSIAPELASTGGKLKA